MYVVYVGSLMLLLAIGAALLSPKNTAPNSLETVYGIRASQMVAYHQATNEMCAATPATCAGAGLLPNADIVNELPETVAAGPVYAQDRFRSYSTGTGVIFTVLHELNSAAAAGSPVILARAAMAYGLIDTYGQLFFTGAYDEDTQTLPGPDDTSVVIPANVGGQAFEDGLPMVASQ